MVAEPPQITHEMALRLGILTRPKAVDDVLIRIEMDAAAGAAIRANAVRILEVPDALLVKEVLAAQGADRADIHDIAGQLVVARLAGEDIDFRMVAAVNDLQLGCAADLAGETHAARAHDAAVRKQGDLIADVVLIGRLILVVDHPALRPAETETVILQEALAGFVAHGTVERVIEKQRLERLHLGVSGLVAVGDNDRAVLGGGLAGGHHLGLHGHGAVRFALADFD